FRDEEKWRRTVPPGNTKQMVFHWSRCSKHSHKGLREFQLQSEGIASARAPIRESAFPGSTLATRAGICRESLRKLRWPCDVARSTGVRRTCHSGGVTESERRLLDGDNRV